MSLTAELLTAAGAAIAGTMGTDVYQYARARVKALIGRRSTTTDYEPTELIQLDALAQAVAALEPRERLVMMKGVQAPVEEILRKCLDGGQADALQELVRALNTKLAEAAPAISHQNITGNIAGGDITTAGRDNNFGTAR